MDNRWKVGDYFSYISSIEFTGEVLGRRKIIGKITAVDQNRQDDSQHWYHYHDYTANHKSMFRRNSAIDTTSVLIDPEIGNLLYG